MVEYIFSINHDTPAFVSKIKALYKFDFFVVVIFAFVHILTCFILLIIWRYLSKHPELCVEEIHQVLKRKITLRILVTPAICLIAVGLAMVNIQMGLTFLYQYFHSIYYLAA